MEMASKDQEDLGLGLKPGDAQYRAYVGPPEDYDLVAAMTFNLLTTLGLRQHRNVGANQTPDILFLRFTGYNRAGRNRFRFRAGSVNL